MRRGANDSNTAPMEIDALQQHGDKKCYTCGRFRHLAKDCWQNKSKSKGKDSMGKGGKKGKGKGKNGWWQWDDGQEWKAPSEQSTAESQRTAPTQPMAEPEAAMGGL